MVQIELEDMLDELSDGKGPKSKLSQAVLQRWISICKMLVRLLEKWDALEACYVRKGDPFPLGKRKDEVRLVVSCSFGDSFPGDAHGVRTTFLHSALLL